MQSKADTAEMTKPRVCLCSAAVCVVVYSASAAAVDGETSKASGLSTALTEGTIKGLLRYSGQHRDSNIQVLQDSSVSDSRDQDKKQYSALGGYLGYETAPWYHTSVGATFYTSIPFGSNPNGRRGLGGLYEAHDKQESYSVLGEIFLRYQTGDHLLKVGRQEMPGYRMVSLSDIRMTPITHEGAVYENRAFDKLQLNLGLITAMKERNDEDFIDMAEGARLALSTNGKQLVRGDFDPADFDDSGYIGDKKEMAMVGVIYDGENLDLEGWNYHVTDFVNSVYLYGNYDLKLPNSPFTYSLSAQYTDQRDVGGHIAGDIDTWHYGINLRAHNQRLQMFASFGEVDYNEGSYDGGTLFVRWGTPQMFNSFQVQDGELAGTKAWGLGLQYEFGRKSLLPGTLMRVRYGDYDHRDNLSQTDARQDRTELTFDLRYSFSGASGFGVGSQLPGWSTQFRLAYNDYKTDYDFEAYRDFHGYDFETATDDFVDARLYLEYRF